jgi:hypothetical protein
VDSLVLRIFRFLDENEDGFINFLEFLSSLVLTLKADIVSRLKFLFAVHLVSISDLSLPEAKSRPESGDDGEGEDDAEEACEATEFFRVSSPSDSSGSSAELISLGQGALKINLSELTACLTYPREKAWESPAARLPSPGPSGAALGPNSGNISPTAPEPKSMPRMKQPQFIQMWKTLYDIFSGRRNEQQMYHSIASVGTVLLKWGEMCLELEKSTESVRNKGASRAETEESTSTSESFEVVSKAESTVSSSDWSISFDQFKAALHMEEPLVAFFDEGHDLNPFLDKLRSRRFDRGTSFVGSGSTAP